MPISAYLNVFDDWDALPEALARIDPVADEIVVVDGAYKWIAPFLNTRDASRSRDEVYDALAPYSSKVRVINAIWDEEAQKRTAGYDACAHRYILRFDADELLKFDERVMDDFFRSQYAVSELDMPIFVTPDYRLGRMDGGQDRQGALFDSSRVSGTNHLAYLWLILPRHLQIAKPDYSLVQREAFAFAPHLTAWRTPATSLSRARFYNSLSIVNGARPGWLEPFPSSENIYEELMKQISIRDFDDLLCGTPIVAGPLKMQDFKVLPSELNDTLRPVLSNIYNRYQTSLGQLNSQVQAGRTCANGGDYAFDVTSAQATELLGNRFLFDIPLSSCSATLHSIHGHEPFVRAETVPTALDGVGVTLTLAPPTETCLQRTLVLNAYAPGRRLLHFRSASAESRGPQRQAQEQEASEHPLPTSAPSDSQSFRAGSDDDLSALEHEIRAILAAPDPQAALLSRMVELDREPQTAASLFESLSARNGPQDYWTYYRASNIYQELGREDAAYLLALRAIDCAPNQPNWHMYRNAIEYLRKRDRASDALSLFERQLALFPESPTLSRNEYIALLLATGAEPPPPRKQADWRRTYPSSDLPAFEPRNYGRAAPLATRQLRHASTRPPVDVALVKDAEVLVYGGAVLVLADGELLPEVSFADFPEQILEKVKRGQAPQSAGDRMPTGVLILDRFKAPSLCHFLLDQFSRLAIYAEAGANVDGSTVVGVQLSESYQREILKHTGIERYVSCDTEARYRFEELWIANTCGPWFRHPAHLAAPWAIEFLRSRFKAADEPGDLKLYISRKDASTRRLHNEDVVERLLASYGFQTVILTGMPYLEQVELFKRASHIVGLHGAGLTNIVFCAPGTKILEVFHPLGGTAAYAITSQGAHLDYRTLVGRDALSDEDRFNVIGAPATERDIGGIAAICNSRDVSIHLPDLELWLHDTAA